MDAKAAAARLRLAALLAVFSTAACQGSEISSGTPVSVAATVAPRPWGLVSGVDLQVAATGALELSGPVLRVDTAQVLGPSNAHLLGTCRNHVSGLFPNGEAKLAAMRALTPTWGGKHRLYRVGHGITDGREDYPYMTGFHFEQCWSETKSYPYDDVRGALAEGEAMDADGLHVVNFGTSTPEEAARYVSYLDHAGDTTRVGYPVTARPVTMFEIGNEICWTHERGHDTYAQTETAYAQRAAEFTRAMRAAADGPIQVGVVASTNSAWTGDGWSGGAATVRNLLANVDADFVVFHGYPSWPLTRAGDLQTILAQNEWNRQLLDTEIRPAIDAVRPGVAIANTEFFTNQYADPAHARGLFGALYSADSLILAMNERMAACVEFCFSHGENADSAYFYGEDPARPTPIYAFQQLIASHWGDLAVRATATGLPVREVVGTAATVQLPELASAAATSTDGSTAYLLVVNRTPDDDVTTRLDFGFVPSAVTAYTLGAPAGWDATDAAVTASTEVLLAGYTFRRATVTLLEARR